MNKERRPLNRILTHWPQHRKQKQKFRPPQPEQNRIHRDAQTEHIGMLARSNLRYECHVAAALSNRCSAIVLTEDRNGSASSVVVHWASQCPEKQVTPGEKKGEPTAHTAYSELVMTVRTETWCYQNNGVVGGTGRSGTYECATSRFHSVLP